MQIGSCWFDQHHRQMIDQISENIWRLNDQEFWVLELLTKHRGQVVPIDRLSAMHKEQGASRPNSVMTHQDIRKIITAIRQFVGREYASLLEYIPEQGAILYIKPISQKRRLMDSPNKLISYGQYFAMILLSLGTLYFVYTSLSSPKFVQPNYSRVVTSQAGNPVQLMVYTSTSSKERISKTVISEMTKEIEQCHTVFWETIIVSFSVDRLSLNIVMRKESDTGWLSHNVKILRNEIFSQSLVPEWLHRVGVCSEAN